MSAPANPLAARGQRAVAAAKARCDHCHKMIVWCRTAAAYDATRMPVDIDPVPTGNIVINHDDRWGPVAGVIGTARGRAAHAAAGWPLHQHHKLSCPYADSWTRPGGPARSKARQPKRGHR